MSIKDLEIAKKQLHEKGLTLSIVKNGEIIYETALHGVSGFLEATEKLGNQLKGTAIADRVVGKAIALLCAYVKVKAVYAIILSEEAKKVLEEHMIYHEWNNLVENILNINKTEICPFEKLATEISNQSNIYVRFKALQDSLKNGR